MGDIIDIRSRLKDQQASKQKKKGHASVTDISAIRSEAVSADRRKVKRTILTEFIAVHTVVPGMGLMKVHLFDINEKGMSFDIDSAKGHFQVGEQVAMRVYLNHQTYFSFLVNVKHISEIEDEQVQRHGAEFVDGSINNVALHHFVKFIETVSASLKHDKGDVLVSNINS